MAKNNALYIGIDIGGTKIQLELFDKQMKCLKKIKVATITKMGQEGLLEELYALINPVFNKEIKGIGVAVPGIVDVHKGVLIKAPHLPNGKSLPLKRLLESKYGIPVAVDNDVNAFLRSEAHAGKTGKYTNVIAVMVGTGVGGGIIANGKMAYGKNGFAGEVGHMVIRYHEKLKTLEQNAGGSFIPQIAKSLGIKKEITAYDLEKNTAESKKVLKHMSESLAIGLSNLNLIFNPGMFILGGSIYNLFLSNKKEEMEKIIREKSLDGTSPKIMNAGKKTSVAAGAVLFLSEKIS